MISKEQYAGMLDTIEMLQDADMMEQVLESEENIAEGNVEKLEI